MSVYYVDIIDTLDDTHTTALENVARSGLSLSWNGNDQKDELKIVGSFMRMAINVPIEENVDAAFLHLFTGDEQRYRVEVRRESDDLLIWHGFLLPDSYNEPYQNGTFFVDFEATDGLGRLKGKYLADSFYKDEKSVTEIIAECLKLTGLSMPFIFSPSIVNFHDQNYHNKYIDTSVFQEKQRKDDAYKILETFCNDLLFCVFQSLGKWYCEGLNKRSLVTYNAKSYDEDGAYIEDVTITRNIKEITGNVLQTPSVTMVPPYGQVIVTHEREPVAFKPELAKETNDGWAVVTGVVGEIYVTEWIGTFNAKALAPNYEVIFKNNLTNVFNESVFVGLLNTLYLQRGNKYKIGFKITVIDTEYNQNSNVVDSWLNPIMYRIEFNGNRLYSNFGGSITDAEIIDMVNTKSHDADFEFVAPENGLLNVKFYQPYKTGQQIISIRLDDIYIEPIAFVEEDIYQDTIASEHTIIKDTTVDFADDASGFSKAFLLEKLKKDAASYQQITIPILYTFTQNGKHYSVVQLDGANLIRENINTVTHDTETVTIEDVVFNYENGEQMAVVHDIEDLTGNFYVRKYYKDQGAQNRSTWYEWTDSVFQIEKDRFITAHGKVLRRMFTVAHPKVDLDIKFPVAFNDIIRWNYIEPANYFINSIQSWDLDTGKCSIIINRAVYQNDGSVDPGDNIPPLVDAGPTIYIDNDQTTASLTSLSSDPDGFIVSRLWIQDTAVAGVVFATPLDDDCVVSNLTADFYTFRITVTDNDGATAFDTVNVVRILNYDLQVNEVSSDYSEEDNGEEYDNLYNIVTAPELQDDFNLTISGNFYIDLRSEDPLEQMAEVTLQLIKNGVNIIDENRNIFEDFTEFSGGLNVYSLLEPFVFNINNTDVIQLRIRCKTYIVNLTDGYKRAFANFNITAVDVATGEAEITTTLPILTVVEAL